LLARPLGGVGPSREVAQLDSRSMADSRNILEEGEIVFMSKSFDGMGGELWGRKAKAGRRGQVGGGLFGHRAFRGA